MGRETMPDQKAFKYDKLEKFLLHQGTKYSFYCIKEVSPF
jgi:hypothetical protein